MAAPMGPQRYTKSSALLIVTTLLDYSLQEALKFVTQYGAEKVRLLEFVRNRGKGGAVRMVSHPLLTVPSPYQSPFIPQGCLSCRGRRVLFLDADGATEITDTSRLENAMDKLAHDHVSLHGHCLMT